MKRNQMIRSITLLASLIALTVIFAFIAIPIGAGLTITLMGVIIAIGASVFGPYVGLVLGFVWGLASFIQGVTGYDPSGPILMEFNAFGLVVTCFVPRMIDGFLVGLVFHFNKLWDKKGVFSAVISAILVCLINTVLFLSCYVGYFISAPAVNAFLNSTASKYNFDPNNIFLFMIFGFGLNFLIELIVNLLIDVPSIVYLKKYADSIDLKVNFLQFK